MDSAVIYARYSSDNQRDASIDQQVKACRAYAREKGVNVIQVYSDRALTGKTDKRPSFLQMIKDSAKGTFQFVIVYSLDRFSRNKYDSAIHKHTLKENGVKVISAMEHISDDPTGGLMETILEGFAQYYSDELSQKINRGLEDNAEKGIVNGSLPIGYRRGPDGRPQIVEEEAEIVREIFRRVHEGELLIRIAEDLNRRGVKTKTGREWNKSSFNSMLSNERYIGVYKYKHFRHENGFPPIIDKQMFYSIQECIATKPNARGSEVRRRKTEFGTYLLTGKLFCGECGALMTGISGMGRHGDRHFYYACVRKKNERACTKKNAPRDAVELAVTSRLMELLQDDELLEWMADQAVSYQLSSRDDDEYNTAVAALKDTVLRRKNILAAIEAGIFTATTKDRLLELEADEKNLNRQISAMDEERQRGHITKEMIISFLEELRDGDVEDKEFQQLMIDSFLLKAYLYDDHLKLIFNLSKEHEEVEIPLEFEGKGDEGEDLSRVCLSSARLHQAALNKPLVYFLRGVFMAVFRFKP